MSISWLYPVLVGVHVTAAIVGVGPVFFFHPILTLAGNMGEAMHAHNIVERLNKAANIGFGALLLSGLSLGVTSPSLFQALWFDLSLVLFFISGIYVNTLYKAKMKQLQEIVKQSVESQGGDQELAQQYRVILKQKVPYEWVRILILLTIIVLMVWKPN
jgi:uncharacterized membrane protein